MSAAKKVAGTVGGKCPICGKPTDHAVRPFCSRRCADIDLARWTSGAYVIAGGNTDSDEDGDEGLAGTAAGGLTAGGDKDEESR